MNKILPNLLALITRKKRYKPNIKWSDKSIVYNLFRVYELIFWRRYGIRAESRAWGTWKNGVVTQGQYFFTLEGFLVYVESKLREFKLPKFKFVKLYQPQFVTPNGIVMPSHYRFAIATDATAQASSAGSVNSLTYAHTVTGSDMLLIMEFGENTGTPSQSTVTYNASSATALNTVSSPFANNKMGWYLKNPSTGANNIVLTRTTTSTAVIRGVSASYSGCDQTTQPETQNTFYTTPAGTAGSGSVTPTASNCWHICIYSNDNAIAVSAGASTTERATNTGDGSFSIFDSNGTITAGAPNTLNFTTGSNVEHFGNTFSIQPSASAASGNFLTLLGVN